MPIGLPALATTALSVAGSFLGRKLGAPQTGQEIGQGVGQTLGQVGNQVLGQYLQHKLGTRFEKKRLDALFPGTNPWERLGSSAGGAAQAGAGTNKANQDRIAEQPLEIAKIQAASAEKVARITSEAALRQAGVSEQKAGPEIEFLKARAAQARVDVDRIRAESKRIGAHTQIAMIEERIKQFQLKYADQMEFAKLTTEQMKNVATRMVHLMRTGSSVATGGAPPVPEGTVNKGTLDTVEEGWQNVQKAIREEAGEHAEWLMEMFRGVFRK